MKIQLISLFLLVFLPLVGWNQKNLIFFSENHEEFPKNMAKILVNQTVDNTWKTQKEIYSQCVEQGYFLCQFTVVAQSNDYDSIAVNLGNRFSGLNLNVSDSVQDVLSEVFPSKRQKNGWTLSYNPIQYKEFTNEILRHFVNHGFPFCRVYLDQVQMNTTDLTAQLRVDVGPYYQWTEIHLKNEVAISMNTLQSIIGIKVGDEYNESALARIGQRVAQTGIFKLKKNCEVLFTKEGVELFIYLESIRSSSAQGIVGLQPNTQTNQLVLTGDIQLKLMNMTKHNESFQLAWKSIQPQTQSLQTNFSVPYLLKSPFGFLGDFQLYKRDSSFLEMKSTIGIQYQFQNGWQLRANYYFNSSSILSSTNVNPVFSKLANLKCNSYGVMLFKRKLDYVPNPREGYVVQIEAQIGERKRQQYQEVIWKSQSSVDYFLPLTQRMTLRTLLQFDTYNAPEIYQNELYRFGGANSLRGFNEETIFASTKAFLSLEWRYLLDKNSNIFVFYNQAYYENNALVYLKDHPYGFGLGLSAGTNIGIFRISYALGSQFGNPMQLNAGKIHFGYISYF